jgi:hypothetical protein
MEPQGDRNPVQRLLEAAGELRAIEGATCGKASFYPSDGDLFFCHRETGPASGRSLSTNCDTHLERGWQPTTRPGGRSGRPGLRLTAAPARSHPSGGIVIERAAILAEGADFEAVMAWIVAHGGEPEATVPAPSRSGLHGSRVHDSAGAEPQTPSRFVLPPGALR